MELMMKSMGDISMKPDADVALGISMLNSCLEPTVTDQREETMKLMSTADNRQCASYEIFKIYLVNKFKFVDLYRCC